MFVSCIPPSINLKKFRRKFLRQRPAFYVKFLVVRVFAQRLKNVFILRVGWGVGSIALDRK